jgi:hypothetical protein
MQEKRSHCGTAVIARSNADEAIRTADAETNRIASLALAMTADHIDMTCS